MTGGMLMDNGAERCICCGEIIPEGRQVCPMCSGSSIQKRTGGEKENMMAENGFDHAIRRVKDGYKMKRKGWNGKDQYIELATNVSFTRPNGEIVNVNHEAMGNKAIAFHGTSGVQLGWLASQADMLAEDWVEV